MIHLTETIIWDETLPLYEQTIEAQQWFAANVTNKLAYSKHSSRTQPVYDEFDRPQYWEIVFPAFTFTIVWNYIKANSSDWAKESETITVTNN